MVRAHHEWYNGEGYPDGNKGDEIPRHAQLIALADAFDAMTTDRPYREALSPEEAIDEILRFRGTQFSPSWRTPSRRWCGRSRRWTIPS